MTPAEITVQRRNTVALIKHQPFELSLTRSTPTRNQRGGYDKVQRVLRPQTVAIVKAPLPRHKGATVSTTDGQQTRRYDRIVGDIKLDIVAGDTFLMEGLTWVVSKIINRPYQTEASIEEQ